MTHRFEEYDGGRASMAGLNPAITLEPGKMGGEPCIRGLRFTVSMPHRICRPE